MSRAQFAGTCVTLPGHVIDAFDETARDITYRTFRKHVGRDVVADINEWAGWPGTHFSRDYAVSFAKGLLRGRKAVAMYHSSIHHLWVID